MKVQELNQNNKLRVIALLLGMSAMCCVLLAIRVYLTHQFMYIFLIWNLFLALIPLGLAYKLYKVSKRYPGRYFLMLSLGIMWLLFFPNAPYLITDFIHLKETQLIPLWYDAFLLFSFAVTGLLCGLISLHFVHEACQKIVNSRVSWIIVTFVLFLSGYGIYLGRVLRWNSWDIFFNTKNLLMDAIYHTADKTAIGITLGFSLLMFFIYALLISFMETDKQKSYDN
ncbi:MAG: DUF1361 domain-containing protein [Cytophagaceae bacterium]